MKPRTRRLRKLERINDLLSAFILACLKDGENNALIAKALHHLDYLITLAKRAPVAVEKPEKVLPPVVDPTLPVTEPPAPIAPSPETPLADDQPHHEAI